MKQTTFQHPELRDANDNIIQQGAFGKNTALANSTNDGWIDYVANDLEALYNNTMGGTGGEINTETITGKTGAITNLTATTVKAGTVTADALNGPLTGNVTGTADKAIADGKGNNIVNTYVTKSGLASSVTTGTGKVTTLTATDSTFTNVTITGTTSVPTANAGNSSKAIANTAYVQGELTNYLPLSGGTLTGVVNGVTPPNGDNSKKLATTAFVNAKAAKYLPLSGGTMTGNTLITMGNGESYVRNWGNGLYLGGTNENNSSSLVLFTNSTAKGFQLRAGNGTTFKQMIGKPDGTLTWNSQPLLPVGIVQAFAGTTIPNGWLLCDGSAVSRTDYATLFAVIGTTYGAGNGSTTFNLPNLIDKFVEGSATAGTVKSAGLPNIKGFISFRTIANIDNNLIFVEENIFTPTGPFYKTTQSWSGAHGALSMSSYSPYAMEQLNMDASRSSSIYGNSTTVQPPALTMRYIIKY